MKRNAAKSVPLGGAFWDAGAQVFINRGTNGRWTETLTPEEVAAYEARAVRELGPECARGRATGEGLLGPPGPGVVPGVEPELLAIVLGDGGGGPFAQDGLGR